MDLTPKKMFFTKGVGYHKNKLQSFELALRQAGIAKCNLVTVSSIFPPNCIIVSKSEGAQLIQPGAVTFVVMAREATDEPNRLVGAAIGLARPMNKKIYGYLSEHHGFGQTMKKMGYFAEDLAATMLGSTLGIEVNPDEAWDSRKSVYRINNCQQFISRSIVQTAEGHKNGLWTTTIAAAVMLLE